MNQYISDGLPGTTPLRDLSARFKQTRQRYPHDPLVERIFTEAWLCFGCDSTLRSIGQYRQ